MDMRVKLNGKNVIITFFYITLMGAMNACDEFQMKYS